MSAFTTPPTGTVTFLFTDIEGSTRLWEQHPDAMRVAHARHDMLLRSAVEQHHGYVIKTTGDGIHAAFATAPEALAAVLAAQRALRAEPWGRQVPISVRMGLHTGIAERRDGDYYGGVLNRAARLMAAGHGGQVLVSAATQELVRDHLPDGAGLHDLGRHRLKDLGRPEQVFQLLHPALPADFPPLRSLDNPGLSNNLPQQPTSFIGREKQVEEVKALLGRTRLLTLTGAGGAGKTRLSLQVAADLLDGGGDGVWLIELAALSDPALVPQAVADVLGIKEQAGESVPQTLMEALKAKRLLLILDNCEHLVSACASLAAALLRSCPNVHILASSREPLNVPGEQTYRVPSLTLPDPKRAQTVESLSQFEAVRLFIERAQAVQPSFAVTNGNVPAVAQVCFRLDGIPLALELAAARVRAMPVEQIMARMDNQFRLLTGGSRTAPPRQQTLRALIDWSYDLLTGSEKTLLRRLSVFAGGWTLEAAEAVCSGDGAEDFEVLDLMTGLVDKSLVVYEERGAGDRDRYRLLETVRQYAGDHLAEGGEVEAVQERAASWFLGLAEEAEPQLAGPEQGLWLSRLETEHDNLRARLSWLEQAVEGAEANLRLSSALWRFWSVRGYYSEGRQRLGRALQRTEASAGWEASATRAKALNRAGDMAESQGDYGTARSLYEESLTIRQRLGDQNGVANSLNRLGQMAEQRGDYAEARTLLEESLTVRRQLRHKHGITASLDSLGDVAVRQGDYKAAQALYEEGLAIRRMMGHQESIADSLGNLGYVTYLQGSYEAARTLYEESLTIRLRLGSPQSIACSLDFLADVAKGQGDYARARNLHNESLATRKQLGDQHGIAYSLEGIAGLAQRQNQLPRAAHLMGAAFSLRESIGARQSPVDQEGSDNHVANMRETLGEEAFSIAWNEGRAMPWEQAVEYALAGE